MVLSINRVLLQYYIITAVVCGIGNNTHLQRTKQFYHIWQEYNCMIYKSNVYLKTLFYFILISSIFYEIFRCPGSAFD